MLKRLLNIPVFSFLIFSPVFAFGAEHGFIPNIFGIKLDFIIFALILAGVAVFHKHTMVVALTGLAAILAFKLIFYSDFSLFNHFFGTPAREGEWRILLNLLGLLFGFTILTMHFEDSGIPDMIPAFIPSGWIGSFTLLAFITFISSFIDNIAAAMIGGSIAMIVYRGRVHVGYLAAIIAASNAGGAWSVVGDTTTTLMWIDGVNPLDVTHAGIGSLASLFIFGIIAAVQQNRYQPVHKYTPADKKIEWKHIIVVLLILVSAIIANYTIDFPAAGVWAAILIGALFTKTRWKILYTAIQGTIFLMALVTCASLMPVQDLPAASWQTSFSLGFVSAVFDNIPLTKLCLEQGGYDWGILAYTVGFGGSMLWFGSSAGVALSNMFYEAKSVVNYVKKGWHVTAAYIIGFFIMLALAGWNPHTPHKKSQHVTINSIVVKNL